MINFIEQNTREGDQLVAWSLLNEAGDRVKIGTLFIKDGRTFKVTDGTAPKHAASTGRIYGEWVDGDNTREYFPNVFDCQWVKVVKTINLDRPPSDPIDAVTAALTTLIRGIVKEQLVDVVQATVAQMATDGALDEAVGDVVSNTLDDGEYMSGHEFDITDHFEISDYFDEIRDGFGVDMRRDVESVIKELIHDDSLVIRLV